MNRCDCAGWVVGNRPLPEDPSAYDLPAPFPKLGCTHLRCSNCKQLVRNAPGLAMKNRGSKIDLQAVYAMPNLSASPLFAPDPQDRFYFCHCQYHTEFEQHPLTEPDSSLAIPVAGTWYCEGHPVATLPHDFEGARVTDGNLVDTVNKALHGWLPDSARAEDRPRALWLARVASRLDAAHADTVDRTVAAALDDNEVRTRALHYFVHRPSQVGAERALAILEGDREGYASVADAMTSMPRDSQLEHTLWRVAAPLVAGAARDLARRDALAGKGTKALFDALAAGDTQWLLAHAAEIAGAAGTKKDDLVATLKHKLPEGVDGSAALKSVR